ncbi:hypothetical protein PAAG_07776 [Paracoccidioides lutzii Pb01]|uniref:Uncharacterized protein n=1 Tax=Paracoccidioides lutzii (strain ATCC MYA-826 / Pb01) TaxID=502779 RepID=C1HA47_PARBA|nr:hypothetical protein PAAG_07776 [Paracoccidioides lutzii Pb01]EEH37220.2 hypothetical protein PAAG_07776 [Paracoccidioides lutzii Pb01]
MEIKYSKPGPFVPQNPSSNVTGLSGHPFHNQRLTRSKRSHVSSCKSSEVQQNAPCLWPCRSTSKLDRWTHRGAVEWDDRIGTRIVACSWHWRGSQAPGPIRRSVLFKMRKRDGSAETGHEPCHVVVVDKVDGEAPELDARTDEAKQLVVRVRDCERHRIARSFSIQPEKGRPLHIRQAVLREVFLSAFNMAKRSQKQCSCNQRV